MADSRRRREEGTEMMAMTSVVTIGAPLAEVALPRLGGGELAFRDLRGRKLLLYFWGSW